MIHDLGIIMLTAGIVSILFKWLRQPVVLGYLVAGLLVGPYVAGQAWISDIESAEHWAEIGMIFLLFSMGLEFSFKKLLQVGSTAIVGCLTIVVGMMTSGFLVGRALGFNEMNALFLGGMLCMSSTTIVFKALDDLGLRQQKFAGISLGILVVEDLFAVVLMVLLASIAVKQTFEGGEMVWEISKLVAYLVLWFVSGIMIIPTFFKYCKKFLNDETMTIVSLGLCLGMVLLAVGAGFSAALGAFVMGSILAETVEAERVEHLVTPVKNMFGAIFFVSVGMMIDPQLLLEYWLPITIISFIVIFGQIIFASLGVILSGQPLKTAMQTGFTLVQVGEFSFILAQFGESIGVTEKYLYPVIVAVSVITTFLTPYIIKLALPAYERLNAALPAKAKIFLEQYAENRNTISEDSVLKVLLRKVVVSLAIYLIIIIFVIAIWFNYLSALLVEAIDGFLPTEYSWVGKTVALVALLLVLSPFIYKLSTKFISSKEMREVWRMGGINRGYVMAINLVRLIMSCVVIIICIQHYFALTHGVLVVVALMVVGSIFFSKRIGRQSRFIEEKFLANLNARETVSNQKRAVRKEFEHELLENDLHIADFELPSESVYCGKQLMELDIRNATNVTVVRIIREGRNINVPGGRERIFPHDIIVVAGSDHQISLFKEWIEKGVIKDRGDLSMGEGRPRTPFTLEKIVITATMPFCGKTIAQSHIREKAQCAVLGIEHEGETYMNPDAQMTLSEGDTITLCGEAPRIKSLLETIK